jgi:hypothetical protein
MTLRAVRLHCTRDLVKETLVQEEKRITTQRNKRGPCSLDSRLLLNVLEIIFPVKIILIYKFKPSFAGACQSIK